MWAQNLGYLGADLRMAVAQGQPTRVLLSGDGNRPNTNGQTKALLRASWFNWSQLMLL